jgi:predicted dehydrogenase
MAPVPVNEAAREGRPSGRTLTAAVVGAGAVAKQHLACVSELPGAEVAAVCDLSPAVAESVAERFQVPAHYTDHRALLADVGPDVVHVTTPPGSHFAVAMDALRAGAHVIVEKPIVAGDGSLDELLDEAARRGLVAIENYNYVFNPQVREARRLIETGELGQLVHVDVDLALDVLGEGSPFADRNVPHPVLRLRGGVVADFLPHLASLAYFLVGPHRGASVVWSRRRDDSPLEVDDMRALVDGERATASLSFSGAAQPDGFWLRVHGTRMRLAANLFEPRLTVERVLDSPRPLFPVLNGIAEIASIGRAAATGLWGKLSGAPGGYAGLWELVGRTYAAIASGAAPPVAPGDVRAVNGLVAELTAEQRER